MVSSNLISIRTESSNLNIAKSGSTSLFVDQGGINANDSNDGYDWDRPYKTIQAALDASDPWTEIWIRSGLYEENLVVPHQNIKLHGIIQTGTSIARVKPISGSALDIQQGSCEFEGLSFETVDAITIKTNYSNQYIHDCNISIENATAATLYAIYLFGSYGTRIFNNVINGNSNDKVIGVFINGSATDVVIAGNYITLFGSGVGMGANVGYGIAIDDAQRCAFLPLEISGVPIPNTFDNNYIGVYFYPRVGYLGHSVQHNIFSSNQLYDIYDPNSPDSSGIVLRENFYAYTGWSVDRDHDGRADIIISAYNNYDYLPLASPWSWMTAPLQRMSTL